VGLAASTSQASARPAPPGAPFRRAAHPLARQREPLGQPQDLADLGGSLTTSFTASAREKRADGTRLTRRSSATPEPASFTETFPLDGWGRVGRRGRVPESRPRRCIAAGQRGDQRSEERRLERAPARHETPAAREGGNLVEQRGQRDLAAALIPEYFVSHQPQPTEQPAGARRWRADPRWHPHPGSSRTSRRRAADGRTVGMLARLWLGAAGSRLWMKSAGPAGRGSATAAPPAQLVVVAGTVRSTASTELGVRSVVEPGGLESWSDRVGNALHARQHEGDPTRARAKRGSAVTTARQLRERLHVPVELDQHEPELGPGIDEPGLRARAVARSCAASSS